jgi:hypothetical protein
MALRLIRITIIGSVLAYGFQLSRQAGLDRGNEELPGMLWAIGALSFLFFVRAFVTENTESTVSSLQKDLLWGLSAGGVLTILWRLLPISLRV